MHSTRVWHLLARKLTGDATLEELQELEQFLLQDAELASNADLHNTYFETITEEEDYGKYEKSWEKQLQRLRQEFPADFGTEEKKKRNIRRVKPLFAWMAAAALIVTGGLLVWTNNLQEKTKLASEHNINEKRRVTLPDGTLIWLNKNSTISYNEEFGIHNRDIVLSGEAFFDVVHKAELPMTIHAGPVDITVRGTAFNVSAYPGNNKVETSLIRGAIELSVKDNPGQKVFMNPNEKVTVTYDSSISKPVGKDARLELDPLTTETQTGLIPEVAWIENKLVFSNESFAAVLEKMGRWYDVKFEVADAELAAEKFTGAFDTETLDQALTALQMSYDFKVIKNKEGTIIISKR